MNIHHLELFYYVALHGGISRAVRGMPYGIQQPAVSEQMRLLEAAAGAALFRRRPFQLTAAGQSLWAILKPFFADLEQLLPTLERAHQHLRIAAPETVLENDLPPVLGCVIRMRPGIHFTLRAGPGAQMRKWLADGEVDLVVTTAEGRLPPGIASRPLLSLPLVLLVHKNTPFRTAAEFWDRPKLLPPLVCPDPAEGVGRRFLEGLRQGGLSWPITLKVNSSAMIASLVAEGHGVGVCLGYPRLVQHPKVRVLPLAGFAPVTIAMLWRRNDARRLRPLISPIEDQARQLAQSWSASPA